MSHFAPELQAQNGWAAIANAAHGERDNLVQLEQIDRARARSVLDLAVAAGAKLKRAGIGEYVGSCPRCGGTDRFSINVKKNVFNCRGCDRGGDAIELVRHVGGLTFRDAVERLVGAMAGTGAKSDPQRERREAERRAREAEERAEKTAEALRIWDQGEPIGGSAAEAYLQSRAIILDGSGRGFARYHSKLLTSRYGHAQALLALFRNIETNEPQAISRILLDPDGNKLGRMFLGPVAGAAVKLDPDEHVTHGLHVGEGVETCLAARQIGLRPTWALGSAGAIGAFPTLSGIQTLTFLRERAKNDLAQPDVANATAAEKCGARWLRAGRNVLSAWPPSWAEDFNDAIQPKK
jgi:CHC2 zinc finger